MERYKTLIQIRETHEGYKEIEDISYRIEVSDSGGMTSCIMRYKTELGYVEDERQLYRQYFGEYFGLRNRGQLPNVRLYLLGVEKNLREGDYARIYNSKHRIAYNEEEVVERELKDDELNMVGLRYLFNLEHISELIEYVKGVRDNSEGSEAFNSLYEDIKSLTTTELIMKYILKEEVNSELDLEYKQLKEDISEDYKGTVSHVSVMKLLSRRIKDTNLEELGLINEQTMINTEGRPREVIKQVSKDDYRVYHLPVKVDKVELETSGEYTRNNMEGYLRGGNDSDTHLDMEHDLINIKLPEFMINLKRRIKEIIDNGGLVMDLRYMYPLKKSTHYVNEGEWGDVKVYVMYTEDERIIDFYNKVVSHDMDCRNNKLEIITRYQKFISVYLKDKDSYVLLSGGQPLLTKTIMSNLKTNNNIINLLSKLGANKYDERGSKLYNREDLSEELLNDLDKEFEIINQFTGSPSLIINNMFHTTKEGGRRFGLIRNFNKTHGDYGENVSNLFDRLYENLIRLDGSLHDMYINHELSLDINSYIRTYY